MHLLVRRYQQLTSYLRTSLRKSGSSSDLVREQVSEEDLYRSQRPVSTIIKTVVVRGPVRPII
jgi:hypothetical protein